MIPLGLCFLFFIRDMYGDNTYDMYDMYGDNTYFVLTPVTIVSPSITRSSFSQKGLTCWACKA